MDIKSNEHAFIENGDLIGQVLEIKDTLEEIQKWNAADDIPDSLAESQIENALHDVNSLYRQLVDFQITLLTLA